MDLRAHVAVARDQGDARVGEDARVEAGGLLALVVEPEAGGDALKCGHLLSAGLGWWDDPSSLGPSGAAKLIGRHRGRIR